MSRLAKKCRSCERENEGNASLCQCGADITEERVYTVDPLIITSDKPAQTASLTEQHHHEVNICPGCGENNEPYLDFCACGVALAAKSQANAPGYVAAKNEVVSKKTPDKKLIIVVGDQQFDCKDGDVLGRAGTVACQIFSGIGTVSGQHVSVQLRAGEWWLTNLPLQTGKAFKNSTIVAGRDLPIGDSVQLTGENMLQMSSKCTITLRVV